MSGTLFIVATPIGNLEDLTPRARQTLANVALIAAEDTRHTGRLLSHIGVKTPLKAVHDHNEADVANALIVLLQNGNDVALVSDAGTPLVSDPGYRVVAAAHANGIVVSPVPGPSAVTAALSVCGLATDRFSFEGFLPAKSAARKAALEALGNETRTLVFYESVHRIEDSLQDLVAAFGPSRAAFIGRELSKLHEQCRRADLATLQQELAAGNIVKKGEFVIVVEGCKAAAGSDIDLDRLLRELVAVMPGKQAAALAARVTGEKRNEVYARMLALGAEQTPGER